MRVVRTAATAVILGAMLAAQIGARGGFELPELPPAHRFGDVLLEGGEGAEQPPVHFSHATHRTRATCQVCHLELGIPFEVDSGALVERPCQEGGECATCHDGERAFGTSPGSCDRCHEEPSNREIKRRFQALGELPPAPFGNEVDWVEALQSGLIRPRPSLEPDYEPLPFARDLILESRWSGISPAHFPHREHQEWLDCANCHPYPFNIKKKGTQHFEMLANLRGEFCGTCHLRVAFPMDDCKRCHPKFKS